MRFTPRFPEVRPTSSATDPTTCSWSPTACFPFKDLTTKARPFYGKPLTTGGEPVQDIISRPNGEIYGIKASGKKVLVLQVQPAEACLRAVCRIGRFGSPRRPRWWPGSLRRSGRKTSRLFDNPRPERVSPTREITTPQPSCPMTEPASGEARSARKILVHACFSSLHLEKIENAARIGEGARPVPVQRPHHDRRQSGNAAPARTRYHRKTERAPLLRHRRIDRNARGQSSSSTTSSTSPCGTRPSTRVRKPSPTRRPGCPT